MYLFYKILNNDVKRFQKEKITVHKIIDELSKKKKKDCNLIYRFICDIKIVLLSVVFSLKFSHLKF